MNKKHIAVCLAVMMLLTVALPSGAHAASIHVERIEGASRYETAVRVSLDSYSMSHFVILASGETFADALAGGQLAAILSAPILLTPSHKLDAGAKAEIVRLQADTVYILGGEKTISKEVENELSALYNVERISGKDRYETSRKIVAKARAHGLTKKTVYVDGSGFPDALAAGTLVGAQYFSLALSQKNELPVLEADQKLVLGGKGSLPLPGYVGERIEGKNRYETALNLAKYTYPGVSLTSETVVLVDGTNYPDALSAISIAQIRKAPILLTHPKSLDPDTKQYIRDYATKVYVVGGTNSVSEAIVADLAADTKVHTITFDYNDGSGNEHKIDVRQGEKVKDPHFYLDNFVFLGWNTEADGSGESVDFDTRIHDKNLTVYAMWKPITDRSFFAVAGIPNGLLVTAYDASGPKSVVIPEKFDSGYEERMVLELGFRSFKSLELTDITIPRGVKIIYSEAFRDNKLSTVVFPKGLEDISSGAFRDNRISKVEIPYGFKIIKNRVFLNNRITEVSIPDTVETIEPFAFGGNQIQNLALPGSVKSIGESAFGANKIKHLDLPKSVVSIGPRAFDKNGMETVTLPEGLDSIGTSAFGMNKLKTLTLPDSVSTIGARAFDRNELETLKLSKNLTVIDEGVFDNNKLKSVYIPDSVMRIRANAFTNNELTEVEVKTGCVVAPNAFDPGVTVKFR